MYQTLVVLFRSHVTAVCKMLLLHTHALVQQFQTQTCVWERAGVLVKRTTRVLFIEAINSRVRGVFFGRVIIISLERDARRGRSSALVALVAAA